MKLIKNFFLPLLVCSLILVSCKKTQKFTFAGGFKGGTYYKIGQSLDSLSEFEAKVLPTNGSVDNLYLVSDAKAKYSLTQLDMLRRTSIGQDEVSKNVRVIMPVYSEEIHMLVRKEITDIENLKSKTISIGPANSGMKNTALTFLDQAGVNQDNTTFEELATEKAIPKLLTGELDGVVVIAGVPVKILQEIPAKEKENIHLIDFAGKVYQSVVGTSQYYQKAEIQADTYPWQSKIVKTLVVQSVLITHSKTEQKDIEFLLDGIFDNKISLSTKHIKWDKISKKAIQNSFEINKDIYHPAMAKILPKFVKK
ncbi:MAG: TAXI family TRAP transporter solute-binding subunit [Spirochaetota bacterium]